MYVEESKKHCGRLHNHVASPTPKPHLNPPSLTLFIMLLNTKQWLLSSRACLLQPEGHPSLMAAPSLATTCGRSSTAWDSMIRRLSLCQVGSGHSTLANMLFYSAMQCARVLNAHHKLLRLDSGSAFPGSSHLRCVRPCLLWGHHSHGFCKSSCLVRSWSESMRCATAYAFLAILNSAQVWPL